jgi:hypothetical protein
MNVYTDLILITATALIGAFLITPMNAYSDLILFIATALIGAFLIFTCFI